MKRQGGGIGRRSQSVAGPRNNGNAECAAAAPQTSVAHAGSNPAPDTGAWARHAPAKTYCLIVAVDDSSARTACNGAWNVTDDVELHDNPPLAERCAACSKVSPFFSFDMGGE